MGEGSREFSCPRGHVSQDADFCSVCGAKVGEGEAPQAVKQADVLRCPDCGSERASNEAVFCELCGYNFQTGGHGEVPVSESPVVEAEYLPEVSEVPQEATSPEPWLLSVVPWHGEHDAAAFTVALAEEAVMLGRADEAKGVTPQVDLWFDDAVSRRHALLQRVAEGRYTLRDLGSTNGTEVNGTALTPLADRVLEEGDRIRVGHGTELVMERGAA